MSGTSRSSLPTRSRGWLWTGCAAVLVLIYLILWALYSTTHLSAFARYVQLPPGQVADHLHADFRLLDLTQTEELAGGEREAQVADLHTVWVVAELEVVRRTADPDFVCLTELLGPGGRVWTDTTVEVTRTLKSYCPDEAVRVGTPYRFEQVYQVPSRYADRLFGVVIVNHSNAQPNPVLTPQS